MRRLSLVICTLVFAAAARSAGAQEYPYLLASVDLSGVWIMEAHPDGPGGRTLMAGNRCDHEYAARLNRAQYGTTWLKLEVTGSSWERRSFENYFKVHYRGELHHFVGYASRETVADQTYYDPYCEVVELIYDVEGTYEPDLMDGPEFAVIGPVRNAPPWQHTARGGVGAHRTRVPGVSYAVPRLFADSTGDVLQLGIAGTDLTNQNVFPGDCSYSTTQPFTEFSLSQCAPTSGPRLLWRRGAPPEDSPTDTLRGRLLEANPDGTPTGEALQGGRIRVYDQRTQQKTRTTETDEEWAQYLDRHRRGWVLIGETTAAADGRFEVAKVPVYRRVPVGLSRSGWLPTFLAVEASGVEKEEETIPGVFEPVMYATALLTNRRLDGNEVPVLVRASGSIPLKRAVAHRLMKLAPVQYGPPESAAHDHLDLLEAGTLELTDARDEGVRRAVWSEHAYATAAEFAKIEIEVMIDALVDLINSLVIDKLPLKSRGTGKKLDELKDLRQQQTVAGMAGLGLTGAAATPAGAREAADKIQKLLEENPALAHAEVYDLVKQMLSTRFLSIKYGLESNGLPREHAEAIVKVVQEQLFNWLDLVLSKDASGLVKQEIVGRLAAEAKTRLFDSTLSASYSALTRPGLQRSVQRMTEWTQFDRAAYATDRDDSTFLTNHFASGSTKIQQGIWMARGAAEGLGDAAGVLELGGYVIPAFKGAANVAKIAQHVLNAGSVAVPMAHVYLDLRHAADEAADVAFGVRMLRQHAFPYPAEGIAPNPQLISDLTAASTRLRDAIWNAQPWVDATDGLPNLIDSLASDQPDGVLATLTAWNVARRRFGAQVGAAFMDTGPAAGTLGLAELDALQAVLEIGRATEIYAELWVGAYQGRWTEVTPWVRDRFNEARMAQVSARGLVERSLARYDAAWTRIQGGPVLPAAIVQSLSARSETTSRAEIAGSPEVFQVRARIANISTGAVGGLEARLSLGGAAGIASIVGASAQPIAGLAAADGTAGGPDEVELSWSVRVEGALTVLDSLVLKVELGPTDGAAITTLALEQSLPLARSLFDGDLDGLPDGWERAHGLDPERDDALEDLDEDGLRNIEELITGTRPDLADTDGDGLSDGAERRGAARGFVTDPLRADTDEDGLFDGVDPAPLDPDPAAPPATALEPRVALSSVELTLRSVEPGATVTVSNAGAGALRWAGWSAAPHLVSVLPQQGAAQDGDALFVRLYGRDDRPSGVNPPVPVLVRDVSGADGDYQVLWVWRGEMPAGGIAAWDGPIEGDWRPDGGVGPADPDAGVGADVPPGDGAPSGPDAGVGPSPSDAGLADGAAPSPGPGEEDEGCGCRASSGEERGLSWLWLLLGLPWLGRQRRASRRPLPSVRRAR